MGRRHKPEIARKKPPPKPRNNHRKEQKSKGWNCQNRLRPPPGFDDRPYQCCFCRATEQVLFYSIISAFVGAIMCTAGMVGATEFSYHYIWAVYGGMKLATATLGIASLMRPHFISIYSYIILSGMQVMLSLFTLALLACVTLAFTKLVTWSRSDTLFSSDHFIEKLSDSAYRTNMGELQVLLAIYTMVVMVLIWSSMEVCTGLRYRNYALARARFLRKGHRASSPCSPGGRRRRQSRLSDHELSTSDTDLSRSRSNLASVNRSNSDSRSHNGRR